MRFLAFVNNARTWVTGKVTSTGAGSAGEIPQADTSGKLDISWMPTGIGADTLVREAAEALSANRLLTVIDDAGTPKLALADATVAGRSAVSFCEEAFAVSALATAYNEGTMSGLTGLTIGATYYLGTAGQVTLTPSNNPGDTLQSIGTAVSATEIVFEPETSPGTFE